MTSKALIQETLKYLDGGSGRYTINMYQGDAWNEIKKSFSKRVGPFGGLIKTNENSNGDGPIPVTIYTLGDIFNTADELKKSGERILSLPDEIKNIKESLTAFGYTALNQSLDLAAKYVSNIQIVKDLNTIYRVARPLVEKIVKIASIRFKFENILAVSQDVLQMIGRKAAALAKTAVDAIVDTMMETPIFAVYENGEVDDISESYTRAASIANEAVADAINNCFSGVIELANRYSDSDRFMVDPGYSSVGIRIPEVIVDVYGDSNTKSIVIASDKTVYKLNEDYTTTELFTLTDEINNISKVFVADGILFILKDSGDVISSAAPDTVLSNFAEGKIIYSDEPKFFVGNSIYNYDNSSEPIITLSDNIVDAVYDKKENVIFVSTYADVGKIYKFDNETYTKIHEVGVNDVKLDHLAVYGDYLYAYAANGSNPYLCKINSGVIFEEMKHQVGEENLSINFCNETENGIYAISGKDIYKYAYSSSKHAFVKKGSSNVNLSGITAFTNGSRTYYIGVSGNKIYLSPDLSSWFTKVIDYTEKDADKLETAETLYGCTAYNDDVFGLTVAIYSQEHIYLFFGTELNGLLENVVANDDSSTLSEKQLVEFSDWFKSTTDDEKVTVVPYTAMVDIDDGEYITSFKTIVSTPFVAVFNPASATSSIMKINVSTDKKASVDRSKKYVTNSVKIYSFDVANPSDESSEWYYISGDKLYSSLNEDGYKVTDSDDPGLMYLNLRGIGGVDSIYGTDFKLKRAENTNVIPLKSMSTVGLVEGSAFTENGAYFFDGTNIFNIINNDTKIDYDIYQICYSKLGKESLRMIRSNNSMFIVGGNSVKKLPLYSSIISSEYGCGYYTDTAPNSWVGAAPYYMVSNILKEKRNPFSNKRVFINKLRESFKHEVDELIRNVPDALITYLKDSAKKSIMEAGIEIEGDDEKQLLNIIADSASSTAANTFGGYVQKVFQDRIGDDATYESFADSVIEACLNDTTHNITKDFYGIFEEMFNTYVAEAMMNKGLGTNGLADSLIRYYQRHKNEWARSITDIVDIDTVKREDYEIPLNGTSNVISDKYMFAPTVTGENLYSKVSDKETRNKKSVSGRYVDGHFVDENGDNIDPMIFDPVTKNYVDPISGEVVCYYNDEDGKYYHQFFEYFTLAAGREPGKTYYEKIGDGETTYSKTEDETAVDGKTYFLTQKKIANEIVYGKTYYKLIPGHDDYTVFNGTLSPNGIYYERSGFVKTEDIIADPNKQYFKYDYVPTADVQVEPDKQYFTKITIENGIYYEPANGDGQYNVTFVEADELDLSGETTYYKKNDQNEYVVADMDELTSLDAVYIVGGMAPAINGAYNQREQPSATMYSLARVPSDVMLPSYYEIKLVPTSTIGTDTVYEKTYTAVEFPYEQDLPNYYENGEGFVVADILFDDNDVAIGIEGRVFYTKEVVPEEYEEIPISETPIAGVDYEDVFVLVNAEGFNPKEKGYYESNANDIKFVASEYGYYELAKTYFKEYTPDTVFTNVEETPTSVNFDIEDANWHESFYDNIENIWETIRDEEFETAKAIAIEEAKNLPYIIYPSENWQAVISQAVKEYYIPTQGQQYRDIVYRSNMYPIRWDELPSDINQDSFDYALTVLLTEIKHRIASHITLLVDGGEVKCYSCIDASSVIYNIVNNAGRYWYNQVNQIKNKVNIATSKDDLEKALTNVIRIFDDTRTVLKKILDKQSALYAKYIDMIITEQVINDNTSEVNYTND